MQKSVQSTDRQCRAVGCQSVWRSAVTLRATPPHFFFTLFIHLFIFNQLFIDAILSHFAPPLHTWCLSTTPAFFYMSWPHFFPILSSQEHLLAKNTHKASLLTPSSTLSRNSLFNLTKAKSDGHPTEEDLKLFPNEFIVGIAAFQI